MQRRVIGAWMVGIVWSGFLWADAASEKKQVTPETKTSTKIEKIEKKETKHTATFNHNIRFKDETPPTEELHQEVKYFCSPTSKEAAEKSCNQWLNAQKKTVGSRVVFSSCSGAQFLYGQEQHGCMAYLCTGEIKFLLRSR